MSENMLKEPYRLENISSSFDKENRIYSTRVSDYEVTSAHSIPFRYTLNKIVDLRHEKKKEAYRIINQKLGGM